MKYINKYETYTEIKVYHYIDSLVNINESILDVNDIKKKISTFLDKIKNVSKKLKRKYLIYFISSLMTVTSHNNIITSFIASNDPLAISIIEKKFNLKNPLEMKISEDGIEHIKNEEKPKLTAYSIGDGMITIGWGHAEKENKSTFKVGEKISLEKAQELFNKDIENAENGVKRIFKQWQNKGIYRKLTQSQFDALVSMGFNMGITGLKKSDVMKYLKDGKYEEAGEAIKYTKINNKFPGLKNRRNKESSMFLSKL